jgi:hypothetical protein
MVMAVVMLGRVEGETYALLRVTVDRCAGHVGGYSLFFAL